MKRKDTLLTSEQAVSVVVGALLVLSILIIAAVQYQNNVIPAQEEETEFQHNREVRGDLQQLRSNIIATSSSGQLRTSSIAVGTRFDQQFIFGFLPAVHSPNPAGSLTMYDVDEDATGTNNQNITITGADGQGGASNYWQASEEYNFNTSFVNYEIDYSRYQQPPKTYYENTILYERVPTDGGNNTVVQTNQNIIQGKNINIVTISGDLGTTTTQSINVQSHPVSAPSQTITVYSPEEGSGGPLTITMPTNLSATEWCTLGSAGNPYDNAGEESTACEGGDGQGMLDGQLVGQGGYITNLNYTDTGSGEPNVVNMTFKEDETFTLQLSRVHLQSQADRSVVPVTNSSYVAWRGSDRINFRENSRQAITAQVRDEYNNPVEGVDTVSVAFRSNNEGDCIGDFVSGQLGGVTGCPDEKQPGERTSGQNGEVTFFYDTPSVQDDTSINLQVELANNSEYASVTAPPTTFQLSGQNSYASPRVNDQATQEVPTNRITGDTLTAELGNPNGIQYQYEPVESQVDNNRTLRVLDARLNKSSVIQGKRVKFTLVLDNTGVNNTAPISFAPTIQDDSGVSFPGAVVSSPPPLALQAGEQYEISYVFELENAGNYTVTVANTNIAKDISVVEKSGSVYDGEVQSSVERQSIAKIVTSYKDQLERPDQTAWNPSIPPVVETGDGQFVNDAEGLIYDFGDAQEPNNQSLTLESNGSLERMNLGTSFENVPQQNHYTLQLNYEIESEDASNPVELLLVERDGSVIDPNTSYQIKGNQQRQTRYFTLSKEESDYVRDHKNIYVVFTAEGNHTLDLYYFQSISSNRILDLSSANTRVSDMRIENSAGVESAEFAQGSALVEPIYVKITKENTGSKVAQRSISLEIDNQIVASREVTINPQSSVTETFVRYGVDTTFNTDPPQNTYPIGYYLLSSEGSFPTQIKVGNPTGTGNYPPVAKISTGVPRVSGTYVPSGETAADDTALTYSFSAATTDPNNDPLTHEWTIKNKRTGVVENVVSGATINQGDFPSEGLYTVTLNSSDGTESDSESIEVGVNGLRPNVQFETSPNPAPAGTDVQLDASKSVDVDGTIAEYRWTVNGSVVETTTDGLNTLNFPAVASYQTGVIVVDDDGNTYERTTTLDTFASNIVANYDYTPGNPTVLDTLRLNASASTAVNGIITSYTWYVNGTYSGQGEINQVDFDTQGPKNISLELEGSDGSTAQTSKTVVIGPPFTAKIDAETTDSKIGETIGFNSFETEDPSGIIQEIEWTMGDGNSYENTQQLAHEYQEPGEYTVTLTVRGGGYEDTDTVPITITAVPPRAIAEFNSTIFLNETVTVYGENSYHPEGFINFYSWNMGDGSSYSTENVRNHRYSRPTQNVGLNETILREPYNASLTVTGNYGLTDTDSVNVSVLNRGPNNQYTVSKNGPRDNGATGEDYSGWVSSEWEFNGGPSYHYEEPYETISVYKWIVTEPDGDVKTYNGEVINRRFTELGNYSVKYAIRDSYGYWNNSTFTFNVDARDPEASFVYTPQEPGPSEPVDYDASSTKHNEPVGVIQSYEWNFDDGTANNTGETTTHIFDGSNSQTYTVTLTVTDQWGQTSTVSKDITTDPYQSCHELLINRQDATSGNYPIDPDDDGAGTISVYCEMDYDGGGWTVIDKQTMWDIGGDVSRNVRRNGNIRRSGVSRNEVFSVDGNGDHSFVYEINTGFTYKELRVMNYKLGATSYRVNGATSEMRGDNTALQDWDGLNSGGVSGDGGFGTSDTVLDSYSNAYNGQCNSGGRQSWPTCDQYTGDSGVNTPPSGTPYFWDNGDTYQLEANTLAVGWGESGGQDEGWEWERGEFWVRQPVGTLIYFYDRGDNNRNFRNAQAQNGYVDFQNDRVVLQTNGGETRIENGQNIDLSRYNEVYVDYILTKDGGSSGTVELGVNGRTATDTITEGFLVNDGSLEIDTQDLNGDGTVTVAAQSNGGADTTVEVKRIWGREGGATQTINLYQESFDSGTDGWSSSSTNNLETTNGWMRLQCNTGENTNTVSKSFSPNLDANTIDYSVSFAATDSWDGGDGDNIQFQIRDDSGWTTLNSDNPQWDTDSDGSDTVYDCRDGNWGSVEYTWSGSYNVDGQVREVRFVLNKNQDDEDEGLAITDLVIERTS